MKKSGMELMDEEDEAVRRFFFGFAFEETGFLDGTEEDETVLRLLGFFEETGFLDGTEEDEELSLPPTLTIDDDVSLELELLSSANASIDV